jgi:hypothetical protein
MKPLQTYIVEETAIYYIQATDKRHAERKFLKHIKFEIPNEKTGVEIPNREIYRDPENRLEKELT